MGEQDICKEQKSAASSRVPQAMRKIDQRGIIDVLSIYSQSGHASAFVSFLRSLTRAMKYSADGSRGREEWRSSNLHLVLFCPSRPRSRLEERDINLE